MTKRAFDKIAAGLREAAAVAKGEAEPYRVHIPADVDVKAIRKAFGLNQAEFAMRYGFNVASIRDWEQGRSHPSGPVRAYLMVIAKQPKAVAKALDAA